MANQFYVKSNLHNNFKPTTLTSIDESPKMSHTDGGHPVTECQLGVINEIPLAHGLKCVVGQTG